MKKIRMWEVFRLDHRYYWLPYNPEAECWGWTGGADEIEITLPENWDAYHTAYGDIVIVIPGVTQGTTFELIKNYGDEPYIYFPRYGKKPIKVKLKYEYIRPIK